MQTRVKWTVSLFLLAAITPLPIRAAETTPADPAVPGLAERLTQIAQMQLRGQQIVAPMLKQSIALLEAAHELNPDEERYARLLVEAALQAGDMPAAINALNACRKLDPTNRRAQVQLMDVYLSRMETADQKVAYLKRIFAEASVPAEIRAHAGVVCASLLNEQTKREAALAMLNQSLQLNPISGEGLRLHYEWVARNASPAQRVSSLLAMMRANPAQPDIAASIGRELAAAGLVDAASTWYGLSLGLTQSMNRAASPAVLRGYATELFLKNQGPDANQIASALVSADPATVDNWYILLAIRHSLSSKADFEKVRGQMTNVLFNQLAVVRKAAGNSTATTRPVDLPPETELPDLTADVTRLKQPGRADLRRMFANTLAELAWVQLYFSEQPDAAAKIIADLKPLLAETDPVLARLEGWQFLLEGKKNEARVKLSAVADRDPLAALGLIRLQTAAGSAPDAVKTQAASLLNAFPADSVGAVLWDALHNLVGKISPLPYAASIQEYLNQFPMDWLTILDQPQAFYSLHGEVSKVTHDFAEPILGTVTIQNVGKYDLTIGADGIIQPDLWFDTQLRGVTQQFIPGSAFDRMSRQIVLHPGESISQTVRLDQGQFSQLLASNCGLTVQANFTVTTNPTLDAKGVRAGPAGYRVKLQTLIERTSMTINSDESKQRVLALLDAAAPAQKLQKLDLLLAYARAFSNEKAPPGLRAVAMEFMDVIRRNAANVSPSVQAWATFLYASSINSVNERQAAIVAMLGDSNWTKRLLGLVAVQSLPLEKVNALVAPLAANDTVPEVRKYAQAVLELLTMAKRQATTAPSTTAPAPN